MRQGFCVAVITAVLGGALLAGCGSSSSSSSGSSAPSTSSSSASSTPSSSGASASGDPAVQQAVAACKTSINSQPTLSADVKSKLVNICDKAANGDSAGVKKATAQVCQELIKATVPASAQAQALASCPKA